MLSYLVDQLMAPDTILIQWQYPKMDSVPKEFTAQYIKKYTPGSVFVMGPKNTRIDRMWELYKYDFITEAISKIDINQFSFYIVYDQEIVSKI